MKNKKLRSSHDMLTWQYKMLIAELQHLEMHASGDCPCILNELDPPERCVGKHSLNISSLARETARMDPPNKDMLLDLADEADEKHEGFIEFICHRKDLPEFADWARLARKRLEPIYYTCKVKLHDEGESDESENNQLSGEPATAQVEDSIVTPQTKALKSLANEVSTECPDIKGVPRDITRRADAIDRIVEELMSRPAAVAPPPRPAPAPSAPASCPTNKTFAMGITTPTRYEFTWKLVEAKDLIVSHDPFTFEVNPKFVAALQPRLRDRAATQIQVMNIASKLQPELLLEDFLSLEKGAPIIDSSNLVLCGNGRVMGIVRAIKDNPDRYKAYRAMLMQVAPRYGFDADQVDRMRAPVLVRVLTTSANKKAFAEECNASTVIESSPIEKAKTDAEKISPAMLNSLIMLENESIFDALKAVRNKEFVVAFLNKLPLNEQAGLVDAKGVLSQAGTRRIAMAIFVATFKGDVGIRLAEKFFESTDPDVLTVFNGITKALASLARAEGLVAAGDRQVDYAFGDDLARVVGVYSAIKQGPGMTVAKYLAQSQMEKRQLNPFQERVLQVISDNARSGKRIGTILTTFAQMVIDSPPPGQGGLMALEPITKAQLFETAVKRAITGTLEDIIVSIFDPTSEIVTLFQPSKYKRAQDFVTEVLGLQIERPREYGNVNVALIIRNDRSKAVSVPSKLEIDLPETQRMIWHEVGHYFDGARIIGGHSQQTCRIAYGKYSTPRRELLKRFTDYIQKERTKPNLSICWTINSKKYRSLDEVKADPEISDTMKYRCAVQVSRYENRVRDYLAQDIELFADGFAEYVCNRDKMKESIPELAKVYDDIFANEEKLKGFFSQVAQESLKPTQARLFDSVIASLMRSYMMAPELSDTIQQYEPDTADSDIYAVNAEIFQGYLSDSIFSGWDILKGKVDMCNLTGEEADRIMSWGPLRDFVMFGVGGAGQVKICHAGFIPGAYQVTIQDVKGKEKRDLAVKIGNSIPRARRIYTQDDNLIYEVVVPETRFGTELEWSKQEVTQGKGERGEQTSLLDSKANKEPPINLIRAYELGKKASKYYEELGVNRFWDTWAYDGIPGLPVFDNLPLSDNSWYQFFMEGLLGRDVPKWVTGWRYGKIPPSGQSTNFRDQRAEKGVSMFHIDVPGYEPTESMLLYQMFNRGKKVKVGGFLLSRSGADGEPILVEVEEIGKAKLNDSNPEISDLKKSIREEFEAVRVYQERAKRAGEKRAVDYRHAIGEELQHYEMFRKDLVELEGTAYIEDMVRSEPVDGELSSVDIPVHACKNGGKPVEKEIRRAIQNAEDV